MFRLIGAKWCSLVVVLLVPVSLGQLARAIRPLARTAVRHWIFLGSALRLFILAIILKAVVDVRQGLSERSTLPAWGWIWATVALCIGVHLIALVGGLWSSRLLGFDRAARIAIAFAGSQKTLPVSLYLFGAFFQESYPVAIVPIVVYHVAQLIVDTLIAEALIRHPIGSKREISEMDDPA